MRPLPPRATDSSEILTIDIKEQADPSLHRPALRVLLLDDRDDFRSILHDHLIHCSYRVTSVQSGVDGLREIMKNAFDIILCDMMMPQMGGEMFYWAVTRSRPAAAQRFIFFTGHKNNPAIDFFFHRINATVLFKPFELSKLDAAISRVLRNAR